MFTRKFFTKNRQRLLVKSQADLVVISANGRLQASADEAYPFRQNSNFWYLTGLMVPDAVLVMTDKSSFIIMPKRPVHADQWEGAINFDALRNLSGVETILPSQAGWSELKLLLTKTRQIHTILPPKPYLPPYSMHTNPATRRMMRKLRELQSGLEFSDLRNVLAELRLVKQASEVAAIKQAITITGEALRVLSHTPIKTEYEAEALLSYEFRRRGAFGHAFEPIVATGVNAATIHYNSNNARLGPDELLLVDCGAKVGMYGADMTRMMAPQRGPSKRQVEVYKAVLRVKEFAESLIKPGTKARQYEERVIDFIGSQLAGLGLINDKNDKKSIRRFFPQLTSHQLGLDIHDHFSLDITFEPGMIMTVEPGIYIPEENIGVRIEDDTLVTKDGIQNLSGHWLPPRQLLELS